jgi:hypothetical protein
MFIVHATVIFLLHINSKINKLLCLRSHHSFDNGGSSVAEPFTINSAIGGSNPVAHSAMGDYGREKKVSYQSKAAAFAVSTDDCILLRFFFMKFLTISSKTQKVLSPIKYPRSYRKTLFYL